MGILGSAGDSRAQCEFGMWYHRPPDNGTGPGGFPGSDTEYQKKQSDLRSGPLYCTECCPIKMAKGQTRGVYTYASSININESQNNANVSNGEWRLNLVLELASFLRASEKI